MTMWGPADSVHALDSVIAAVNGLVNSSHVSAANLKQGLAVARDIKKTIDAVEKGQISKKEAKATVTKQMKDLKSFKDELKSEKLAIVGKLLDQHRDKLDKISEEAELMRMKMDLEEKKDLEQKRLEQKRRDQLVTVHHNKTKPSLAHASKVMPNVSVAVSAPAKVESQPSASKKAESPPAATYDTSLPGPIKAVLESVEAQDRKVEQLLDEIKAEEKKSNADADAAIKMQVPAVGKDDAIKKAQSVLKLVKTQTHRKLEKRRVAVEAEVKELKDAEVSIKHRDITTLQKILAKMEAMKQKSGSFLH